MPTSRPSMTAVRWPLRCVAPISPPLLCLGSCRSALNTRRVSTPASKASLARAFEGKHPLGPEAMKRPVSPVSRAAPKSKRQHPSPLDNHPTPCLRDEAGEVIWPAPREQIQAASDLIREWLVVVALASCSQAHGFDSAEAQERTLIVPDKDADGLASGVILQRTLVLLGLEAKLIEVHLLHKGCTVHDEAERRAMTAKKPAYIFVLDQGSRKSPPVADGPHKALVIDHHWARDDDFPRGAQHVTACHSPPVATSSLLTYHLCAALHPDVGETCGWLCVVGTHGDLGNSLKWEPPFPDMTRTLGTRTRKALNEAVSLVNAPRRTAAHNVEAAWTALAAAESPRDVAATRALATARAEVNAEVARCARAAPSFSADARVAVVRISSEAQGASTARGEVGRPSRGRPARDGACRQRGLPAGHGQLFVPRRQERAGPAPARRRHADAAGTGRRGAGRDAPGPARRVVCAWPQAGQRRSRAQGCVRRADGGPGRRQASPGAAGPRQGKRARRRRDDADEYHPRLLLMDLRRNSAAAKLGLVCIDWLAGRSRGIAAAHRGLCPGRVPRGQGGAERRGLIV